MPWEFVPDASPIAMTDPAPRKAVSTSRSDQPTEAARPGAPTEEMALVHRARAGDMSAYDDLVRRYQERIYATIYHMTSNHEDASDLAQESFIKAFQALKSFKGGSSFYTWVYRIAVNKTINFLKQRRNRAHMSLNDLDFNAEHDPDLVALISDKTPRRDVALSELQEKLNEAMQKLSDQHRLVVSLHDVQGLSHEEIAQIMDCNIGTVRSRLFYARQQLQAYLSDYLK
jgi:RNA polymerase sigma factor (sigma-70 family)